MPVAPSLASAKRARRRPGWSTGCLPVSRRNGRRRFPGSRSAQSRTRRCRPPLGRAPASSARGDRYALRSFREIRGDRQMQFSSASPETPGGFGSRISITRHCSGKSARSVKAEAADRRCLCRRQMMNPPEGRRLRVRFPTWRRARQALLGRRLKARGPQSRNCRTDCEGELRAGAQTCVRRDRLGDIDGVARPIGPSSANLRRSATARSLSTPGRGILGALVIVSDVLGRSIARPMLPKRRPRPPFKSRKPRCSRAGAVTRIAAEVAGRGLTKVDPFFGKRRAGSRLLSRLRRR